MNTLKELIAKFGEGNLPLEATAGPETQGICCAGGGDIILETEWVPVTGPLLPGQMTVDEWNAAGIDLIIHCVNNFAQVVEALEKLVDYNTPKASVPAYPAPPGTALHFARATLAAAQTIPSGEKEEK